MPSATRDDVPTASFETINFSALERRDAKEIDRLMEASRTAGFFYLDFTNSGAARLPKQKRDLLQVMEEYFGQPDDIKQLDGRGKSTRGYVKKGTFTAVDPNSPDESFEHLAISTHELGTNLAATLPTLFKKAGTLALGVPGQFVEYHDHTKSSDTILAMLSYPGKLTHQKHTDLGSITVLFSDQWGLQVVEPSMGQWEWVEPRENEAVINVGDALRFLSGKTLYSCVHRVVRDGRASEEGHRYSIAYLLRPGDDVVLVDADGSKVTARSMTDVKYRAYSADHAEQEKSSVLTGGMEEVLGVRA
ncbi:gibberellin 20-oxidase [Fusarium albosuccineum]|uniref:Gibberellin 20-oxidase n=1 Tax=Fusarium albosuccineum TaxID=1237068 RepID=A0A8H4L1M5_9HYPO|nr:gibberellin 20-oxidase [Fusarium albosuccineum]